jgi:hypothetical protein
MTPVETTSWGERLRSPTGMLAVAAVVLLAIYTATQHTEHILAALPFAFILLCPLMHLFMHGGHAGHGPDGGTSRGDGSRA